MRYYITILTTREYPTGPSQSLQTRRVTAPDERRARRIALQREQRSMRGATYPWHADIVAVTDF